MPEIAASRFVRYANESELSDLVCPPYDVIDEAGRAALEAKNPHNYVRLILPREQQGEEPTARYARARALLDQWIADGVLARDDKPSILAVEQEFTDPSTGERRRRRGIEALLKLSDFSEGIVLPHERTLSGPKADRLELLRTTAAHLSPIFVLFPDESNDVTTALANVFAGKPTQEAVLDGTTHRAWVVTDESLIRSVQSLLRDRKAFIADGHHRYETALNFRRLAKEEGRTTEGTPLDYIPAFLCSMSDPGLVILPTHRLVHSLGANVDELVSKLGRWFDLRAIDGDPATDAGRNTALEALKSEAEAGRQSLLLVAPTGPARLLTLRKDASLDGVDSLPQVDAVRVLDVALLHALVFEETLGMSRESQAKQENLRYSKDARQAIDAVRGGEVELAFIVNSTPMDQVRAVSEAGEVMPQKSTFFYPKIVDGFFAQPLDAEGVLTGK